MENVPQVHGKKNLEDFNMWINKLESLGYKNYWKDLNAKDYGVPQSRNRCFLVSILGDYNFTFPEPTELKLRLTDLLEENVVDEKYYLSDKMIDYCMGLNQKDSKFSRGEKFMQALGNTNDKSIANTITTNAGTRPIDNFVCKKYKEFIQEKGYFPERFNPYNKPSVNKNLRMRKLLPLECFRLQGVKDKDFEKIAKNQSDASLFHLSGDSICSVCLLAIFGQLLGLDYKNYIDFENWWNVNKKDGN